MSTEEPTKTVESRLEEEGDIAADYLEGLLDIADLGGEYRDWETDRKSTRLNSSHRL